MRGWTAAVSKNFQFKGEFNRSPHGSGDIWFLTALDVRQLETGGGSHCAVRLLHPGSCYLFAQGGEGSSPVPGAAGQQMLPDSLWGHAITVPDTKLKK